jgi:hypothetical protein
MTFGEEAPPLDSRVAALFSVRVDAPERAGRGG